MSIYCVLSNHILQPPYRWATTLSQYFNALALVIVIDLIVFGVNLYPWLAHYQVIRSMGRIEVRQNARVARENSST